MDAVTIREGPVSTALRLFRLLSTTDGSRFVEMERQFLKEAKTIWKDADSRLADKHQLDADSRLEIVIAGG